jgi:hypothetical protein
MKNIFKLKAIQRIAGIIALLAVIGFSMVACSGDDDSGIYGCAYSQTEKGFAFDGQAMTTYLLTITYDQARTNIISKLGQPIGDAGFQDHNFDPPYVIVQVIPGWNSVRLVEVSGSGWKGLEWNTK